MITLCLVPLFFSFPPQRAQKEEQRLEVGHLFNLNLFLATYRWVTLDKLAETS